jgi:hypothetical protein
MLPMGRVAVDREFMLEICAHASPSTTKEAVLAALKGKDDKMDISTHEATGQDSSVGLSHDTMPQKT